MAQPVYDSPITPVVGTQNITSATLASSTVLTVPTGAVLALVQNDSGVDVRWTDDGTTPTATVGLLLKAGSDMWYSGPLAALKFIRTALGSTLAVSYYKIA